MKLTPIRLDIEPYHLLIQALIAQLANNKYDCVYGIERGGIIQAVYIDHALKIPVSFLTPGYILNLNQRVLVVDDIIDTGKTAEALNTLEEVDTASLFWRKETASFEPTYWVEEAHNYGIRFPYETEDYIG